MSGINSDFISGFRSVEQAKGMYLGTDATKERPDVEKQAVKNSGTFSDILNESFDKNGLKFSKHANTRLESRDIVLSDSQFERLSEGVTKAKDKNINETLVMMDNLAFIVNVRNNTVVTALDPNEDSSVFTNIDGAVIV
ncbi:MAG: flagellar protein [Lachnospiraceae bacterium]|nr:flagellar protein [Lachnospiraceae bacterium]